MNSAIRLVSLILMLPLLNINRLAAQDSKLSEYLPNYSTENPAALYNGTPDINIPLYTLKGRGVSIPVSLSYDASGITVVQEATCVGLGWVLNAGGFIIQETRDWFDFAGVSRLLNAADAGKQVMYRPRTTILCDDYAAIYTQIHTYYPTMTFDQIDEIIKQNYHVVGEYKNQFDEIPDIFYYSCNGHSGKFILSKDLSTGISLPEKPVKIERDLNTGYITITADDGTIYSFENAINIKSDTSYIHTTSAIYLLKKIYTPQMDTVEFSYQSAFYEKPVYKYIYDAQSQSYFQNAQSIEMPQFLTKRISIKGGESMEFEFGNRRMDVAPGIMHTDSVPTIKRVKLVDANGNTKKYFELYYSYFNSDPYIQYLPAPKYVNNLSGGHSLMGDYNIKQSDGRTYKLYTNVRIIPVEPETTPGTMKYDLYGDLNGQHVKMDNCFGIGTYVFTWQNGKLYAVLNNEYLQITYPPFNSPLPVCDPDNEWGYINAMLAYNYSYQDYIDKMKKYFVSLEGFDPQYFPNKIDGGMSYFAVDTNFINTLISVCPGNNRVFRPYYYSSKTSARLRLDSLREISGISSICNPAITFGYNPTNLPHSYSADIDHWGYYNYREGKPNLSPIALQNPNLNPPRTWTTAAGIIMSIPANYIYTRSMFDIVYSGAYFGGPYLYQGYRLSNEEKMKACILGKIHYPNGGYIKYNYEANKARINATGTSADIVGGLRLNSIETGTGDGQKYFTRYDYKEYSDVLVNGVYSLAETGVCSGYLHTDEVQYEIPQGKVDDTGWYIATIGVMNSVKPLVKTRSGYVGYSQVAVKKEDDSGNNLGVTLYKFDANHPLTYVPFTSTNSNLYSVSNDFMKYLQTPMPSDPLLGSLQEKIVTDKNGRILSKTTNTYSLATPNYGPYGASDAYYQDYNHYFTGDISEVALKFKYSTLIAPSLINGGIDEITPNVPVLSSVRNFSYFPDGGKTIADSTFYLYDILNSSFEINDYAMRDIALEPLRPFNITTYDSKLDAYHTEGYYTFKEYNTQKLLEELKFKSNGQQIRTRYWYPPHLAATDPVCAKMTARNIISPAVRVEKFQDGKQMEGQKTNYAVFSKDGSVNEDFLLPSESYTYHGNAYELEKGFTKYSNAGSLTEMNDIRGNHSSIIWGYNNSLPIAKVENSEVQKTAYTSFENSSLINTNTDLNNWQVMSGAAWVANTVEKVTGKQSLGCNSDNVTIATKNTMPAGTYKISFWARNYITGSNGLITAGGLSPVTGDTWKFYTTTFTISTSQKITLTLSRSLIDELRLYPADAQMTSYTYDPLFGVTSKTDENNVTTYYEYDGFGRLLRIKDQDGNVLKEYQYHYAN